MRESRKASPHKDIATRFGFGDGCWTLGRQAAFQAARLAAERAALGLGAVHVRRDDALCVPKTSFWLRDGLGETKRVRVCASALVCECASERVI